MVDTNSLRKKLDTTDLWNQPARFLSPLLPIPMSENQQSPNQNQTQLFDPDLKLWLWDITPEDHHELHYRRRGKCCFVHQIGQPRKDGRNKPFFDYEKKIFDIIMDENAPHSHRIWIKKATGLGITEFFIYFMLWLALVRPLRLRSWLAGSHMVIVTGPREKTAKELIKRAKDKLEAAGIQNPYESDDTTIRLRDITIKAYPSFNASWRGIDKISFILIDEADFFRPSEQDEVRKVAERYVGKSQAWIAMISTPNRPGGLFERMESEPEDEAYYARLKLDYTMGEGKIYSKQDIINAKRSPSFNQEYDLQYGGKLGNVFHPSDIEAAQKEYEITEYLDDLVNFPRLQGVMGIDPSPGSGAAGVVITHFIDGSIRVVHADEYLKPDFNDMIAKIWDLIQRFNVTKILVDASFPSFIRALKIQWGENPNYEDKKRYPPEYMKIEPIAFHTQHKQMLHHAKFMLENRYVQIHPQFDKLIISLKTAVAKDLTLDKEATSYDDLLDAFRLCLFPYKEAGQVL